MTHLGWSAAVLCGYLVSAWLLAVVVRTVPVSVAYAIWAGLGPAAVALIGWAYLDEGMSWTKAACLVLITCGVAGLSMSGNHA